MLFDYVPIVGNLSYNDDVRLAQIKAIACDGYIYGLVVKNQKVPTAQEADRLISQTSLADLVNAPSSWFRANPSGVDHWYEASCVPRSLMIWLARIMAFATVIAMGIAIVPAWILKGFRKGDQT